MNCQGRLLEEVKNQRSIVNSSKLDVRLLSFKKKFKSNDFLSNKVVKSQNNRYRINLGNESQGLGVCFPNCVVPSP